jgi:hypothetical protein
MNIFRLVLCLAGLAAYLVAKQWLLPTPPSANASESRHGMSPGAEPFNLNVKQGVANAPK